MDLTKDRASEAQKTWKMKQF